MKLGRYEILSELGRGGMATVFRARDPHVEREVAIKVLPRQFTHDPQFLSRFQREVKTIGRLDNPRIVPVYDVGEDEGQPFLVMPLLTGGTLADRLNAGPLPLDAALRVLDQIADALDDAHAQGVVHRDLKPSNVIFDRRGLAYLSDFGISKALDATAQLTGSGLIGTPAYMSPEQFRGGPIDGRTDVYSLAVLTFEMLAGRCPFEGDTAQLMFKHVTEPPPPIGAYQPDLPPGVEQVLQKALAKNPDDRFKTVGEFVAGLRAAAERRPIPDLETMAVPAPSEATQVEIPRVGAKPAAFEATVADVPPARPAPPVQAGQPATPLPRKPITAVGPLRRRSFVLPILVGVVGVMAVIGVGAVAVIAGLVGQLGQATQPAIAPAAADVGKLAFASDRDGDYDVYLMNDDGTGLINLTNNTAGDFAPAFSPDGRHIAFTSDRDGNQEIYVMNADGSGPANWTNNPADDYSPAWSSSGGEIAFVSGRDGNPEIYVASQTGVTRYTDNPASDLSPTSRRATIG